MDKTWPKVIRDPVHNIIPFEKTECDQLLLDLINTKEVQRLRRIKQLGMSELVFPAANHSRFAHCIGVMHTARRMLERLERVRGEELTPDQRIPVLAAALLHDVGHGPFSHAFEKVTGQSHEARTLEIIQSNRTEVGKRLRKHDGKLPGRLAVFFDEDVDAEKKKAAEIPEYLTQIISSQLDADRFDYLLRDSLTTGTDYGQFDLDWLLLQLRLDGARSRLYVSRKALDAAEAYVFARHHMYRSVYFHKTVRAAEVMVRLALKRVKELVGQMGSVGKAQAVVPDAPMNLLNAFSDKLSLDMYLALDDMAMIEFLKACANAPDKLLSSLARGLVERKLYKAIDVTDRDNTRVEEFGNQARDVIKKARLNVEYAFVAETAADTPYKPYDPDSGKPASQIYVEGPDGVVEISERAKSLKQLRETYKLTRYYIPESIRDKVDRVARKTLKEETGGEV